MDEQKEQERQEPRHEDVPDYEENIRRIQLDGREIILLGTAHVSRESAAQVRRIVEAEDPDAVAVELCASRHASLQQDNRWKDMDIIKIVREKKAGLLLTNLVLGSYQKRIAQQFGIEPGEEMKVGVEVARETNKQLLLVDRDIQITLSRVWHGMNLTGRVKVLLALVMSIFSDEKISEEELEALRKGDALSAALNEMAQGFPQLKKTLIDERDQYIANKLKNASAHKVLAILGAGHLPGVAEELFRDQNMQDISRAPKRKKRFRGIGWMIPLIVVALIGTTFTRSAPAGWDGLLAWILWNGSCSALGALVALAHPLSILTAFAVAPISSLNPLLAAGWFAGLAEAFLRKPKVEEFERLSEDLTSFRGFWRNHVTRILLVVVFANIGSTVGTLIGGAEVIRVFLRTLLGA